MKESERLRKLALWIRAPGNITPGDAIDECARLLENNADAVEASSVSAAGSPGSKANPVCAICEQTRDEAFPPSSSGTEGAIEADYRCLRQQLQRVLDDDEDSDDETLVYLVADLKRELTALRASLVPEGAAPPANRVQAVMEATQPFAAYLKCCRPLKASEEIRLIAGQFARDCLALIAAVDQLHEIIEIAPGASDPPGPAPAPQEPTTND